MLHCICHAQSSNFIIRRYSVEHGLPDQYILAIYQDSRGFLWLGTNSGLSRFDGKNFINYGSRHGLSDLYVNRILEDTQHRLWVVARNKILQFSGGHFKQYSFSNADDVGYINNVIQMRSGDLWALTNKGTYRFENNLWQKRVIVEGFENKPCIQ